MPTQREVRARIPAMMKQASADKALRDAMEAAKRLGPGDALAALIFAQGEHRDDASPSVVQELERARDALMARAGPQKDAMMRQVARQTAANEVLRKTAVESRRVSPSDALDALTVALDNCGIASPPVVAEIRRAHDLVLTRMQAAEDIPKVLRLAGGVDTDLAACLGDYHLAEGNWASNSPVWRKATKANTAFLVGRLTPGNWAVLDPATDPPSIMLELPAPELLNPFGSTSKIWQTFASGEWTAQPRLTCSDLNDKRGSSSSSQSVVPPFRFTPFSERPTPKVISLAGEVAPTHETSRGVFHLEVGRTVNGSPCWKQAGGTHRVARLASGGPIGWGLQFEADVGQNSQAVFVLRTSALGHPCDPPVRPWEACVDGAWTAQPRLRCTDQTAQPTPTVILLQGDLPLSHVSYRGAFRLEAGRTVNDSPVWKQAGGSRRLARLLPSGNWGVQAEENVGGGNGKATIRLRSPELLHPCGSGKWEAFVNGAWTAQPKLEAIDETARASEPPKVLQLSGEVSQAPTSSLGVYFLEAGRTVRDSPVWKQAGGMRCIAFMPYGKWSVQYESNVGEASGAQSGVSLELQKLDVLYPCDSTAQNWQGWSGAQWSSQPGLRCTDQTARTHPSALQLSGELVQLQVACLGVYHLAEGRTVHNSPVWEQAGGRDRRIARSSNGNWCVQKESDVGKSDDCFCAFKALQLMHPCEPTSTKWEAWDNSAWASQPLLKCADVSAQRLPSVLQLSGEVAQEREPCLGVYHLEVGRKVHDSPVWKQAGGTRLIARLPGGNWGVQIEEEVGQDKAELALLMPELLFPCSSSTVIWREFVDGAWAAQPRLKCRDQSGRRTPGVLKLRGEVTQSQAACVGEYYLETGRTVNDSPVWKQAAGAGCQIHGMRRIARTVNGNWAVQREGDVGKNSMCLLALRSPESVHPSDDTTKPWEAFASGAWAPQPRLKCSDETPQPPTVKVLQLSGDVPREKAQALGIYHLEVGRTVNDSPLWKQAGGVNYIARTRGGSWGVQTEEYLGQGMCKLVLKAPEQPLPCAKTAQRWEATTPSSSGWVKLPTVKCRDRSARPTPAVLQVREFIAGMTDTRTECLGIYYLEAGRMVNDSPCWKQAGGNRLLARATPTAAWVIQSEHQAGQNRGSLLLQAPELLHPSEKTDKEWEASVSGEWKPTPFDCKEVKVPPDAPKWLRLTGEVSSQVAETHGECFGDYRLEEGRVVNGSPVWLQAGGTRRIARLARSGRLLSSWGVQREDAVGKLDGKALLILKAPELLHPCDGTAVAWEALSLDGAAARVGLADELDLLECVDMGSPPKALKLRRKSGQAGKISALKSDACVAACSGLYALDQELTAAQHGSKPSGSPVWKRADDSGLCIARHGMGTSWVVQPVAYLKNPFTFGSSGPRLVLPAQNLVYPSGGTRKSWLVEAEPGSGWVDEKDVQCVVSERLRFAVGARVECKVGEAREQAKFKPGVVVKHYYWCALPHLTAKVLRVLSHVLSTLAAQGPRLSRCGALPDPA